MKLTFKFALLLILFFCRIASAHFLWLETEPAEKTAKVILWFSETSVPGDSKLLDKITHAKAWISLPHGDAKPLVLEKQISGDTGAWSCAAEIVPPCCIDATCDYGVVKHGDAFLLQYDARRLIIRRPEELATTKPAKALTLEVRPRLENNRLNLAVLFDGKPAADAQLSAILPNNEERELKVDSSGAAFLETPAPGEYAFRAGVKLKQSGERNGKKYDEVRHCSTLTFRLPQNNSTEVAVADSLAPSESGKDAAAKSDPAAVQLLNRARANRSVWESFPGFTAKVTVRIDDKMEHGTVAVDEHGSVTSHLKDDKLRQWADEQLGSLVDHRLPSVPDDETPILADNDVDHPLGRLIRLGDAKYESSYRIRDDVVTEVNRRAGPEKFTISVFETERNKEGKYLPRTFSATFWDAKSGEIKSSSAYLNTWKRVGNFDLPDRFLEVETTPGERHVKEMTFTDYSLHEKSK